MDLQTYIDNRNITKYHLSKISGIPKTTIIDICPVKALDCTMEDIMAFDTPGTGYDSETGLVFT